MSEVLHYECSGLDSSTAAILGSIERHGCGELRRRRWLLPRVHAATLCSLDDYMKDIVVHNGNIRIEMNGKASPNEIKALFASIGWSEESHLSDDQVDMAFNNAYCNFMARDNDEGRLIGVVRASYDGIYVMLWNLVVRPEYQNRGIGLHLLTLILDEMRERGHKSIAGLALNAMAGKYAQVGLLPAHHLTVVTTDAKL